MNRFALVLAAAALLSPLPAAAQTEADEPAAAQPADPAPATGEAAEQAGSAPTGIELELNKLEDLDGACRAYYIVRNGLEVPLSELEIDVFLFDPDGIVGQRLALAFEAIRARRTKVVSFDFQTACSDIGRMLVNEIIVCENAEGPVAACGERLTTTQRTDVVLEY